MSCARECGSESECRRFKFCETDATSGQCKLYEDGKDCPNVDSGQVCSCFQKKLQCEDEVCTCPIGYYGNRCEYVMKHCSEDTGQNLESLARKISFIQPDGAEEPFEVFCEFRYGGLTTIQNRDLTASPVDFNRSMAEYIRGFGHPRYNFWLGLNKLSLISGVALMKCNIYLKYASSSCETFYDSCSFGGERDDYKITLSDFSTYGPNCGDSLIAVSNINNAPFSTYDSDFSNHNCASKMAAGWWYAPTSNCTQGNLNAPLVSQADVTADSGVVRMKWVETLGDQLLQYSLIRLKKK
ncbi:angiopoietin-related protein 4-like [Haliotis rufescens]|uniref:angiopoietin-related protein 4-like n=1 Tax=Haliotis rufescens TaxID=6454 RepID=UPI00201EA896|nr:angiopoietin-related protein 4-like [Haliotis rufescens]